MSLGPIGVSSSSASSSLATSNQSLSFNPIITLASPESSVSQSSRADQSLQQDQTARADSRAETTLPNSPLDALQGGGFDPLKLLGSNSVRNPASAFRAGDLAGGGSGADYSNNPGVSPLTIAAGLGLVGLALYMRNH